MIPWYYILGAFVIGVFLGLAGMAMLRSGGKADDTIEILTLKQVLRKVQMWNLMDRKAPFPRKDVDDVLKI